MEWMLMPLRRYADFEGRSTRTEYWMFVLFQVLVIFGMILLMVVAGSLSDGGGGGEAFATIFLILMVIFVLGLFIPNLAVQVRRLHDQDKSGWLVLLGFIPYIGGLIMLVLMCLDGTAGPNQYGPDPKERVNLDTFS